MKKSKKHKITQKNRPRPNVVKSFPFMDSNGSVERVLHDPDAVASPEEVSESEDLPESTTWYDSIMDHASRSKECDVADSVAQALWNPYSIYDSRQPIYHASFRQQDGHCDDFLAVEPHYHNCPYIRHARNQDYSIVHDRECLL